MKIRSDLAGAYTGFSSASDESINPLSLAQGNFCEAHQQLRVITARYLQAHDYTSASDVLYNGALLLLRAGSRGSEGHLALVLLSDVYVKDEHP